MSEKSIDAPAVYSSKGELLISSGYRYTAQQKVDIVAQYMATGNLRQVARLNNMHYNMLVNWKREPWWGKVEKEIKLQKKAERKSKVDRIVNKALDAVEDRIDNGDFVYDQKTGEILRKPVSLKEVRGVANDMLQRQIDVDKLSQDHAKLVGHAQIKDQLALLQKEFAKFNTNRTVEVIPSALDEERKERLQEGIRSLSGEAGTDPESLGEEFSEEDSGELWDECEGEGCGPQEASEQGWDEFFDEPEGSEQNKQSFLFQEP